MSECKTYKLGEICDNVSTQTLTATLSTPTQKAIELDEAIKLNLSKIEYAL